MSTRGPAARGLIYLWAGPTSLLGLTAALLTRLSGGRVERRWGLLEAWGGFARGSLRSKLVGARAMTLGHVVLGIDQAALEQTRAHELAHVRQAELWGPLFLPAYLAASAWAWLVGRHYYRDNWFERDARRRERTPVWELERRRQSALTARRAGGPAMGPPESPRRDGRGGGSGKRI